MPRLSNVVSIVTMARYETALNDIRRAADVLLGRTGSDLSGLIPRGGHVVLKPNLVRHFHGRGEDPTVIVTSGTFIAAVAKLVDEQMQGDGLITIADAPQHDCDFDSVLRLTQLREKLDAAALSTPVDIVDLRPEAVDYDAGVVVGRKHLPGDPRGSTCIDLGARSALGSLPDDAPYYGADYDTGVTRKFHSGGRHEYLVCNTPLQADLLINLPKLKTHKKTGITCCLKNLVGINADKNHLPHFRTGTPATGGDEFATAALKDRVEAHLTGRLKKALAKRGGTAGKLLQNLKRTGVAVLGDSERGRVRAGNWYGNDTAWRMVLDLNRLLLENRESRPTLHLVDAIDVGVGDGPMSPDAAHMGAVLAAFDPFCCDIVAARLLGFDPTKLKLLRGGVDLGFTEYSSFAPCAVVDGVETADPPALVRATAHFGWAGFVETVAPMST